MSIKKFEELPGWEFEVDEVSAGVYKVKGKDEKGRNVETVGTDLDSLIDKCKKYAMQIIYCDLPNCNR
jgi:hypothetical protein